MNDEHMSNQNTCDEHMCSSNPCMTHTNDWSRSAQATQSRATMKLPIKQYETHTNNKNTRGNDSHDNLDRTIPRSFQSRQI